MQGEAKERGHPGSRGGKSPPRAPPAAAWRGGRVPRAAQQQPAKERPPRRDVRVRRSTPRRASSPHSHHPAPPPPQPSPFSRRPLPDSRKPALISSPSRPEGLYVRHSLALCPGGACQKKKFRAECLNAKTPKHTPELTSTNKWDIQKA